MELKLIRSFKKSTYTIGKLYIDNKYFCDTLEDVDRNINNKMSIQSILKIKVDHKTAIPTGIYKINMDTKSPRFSNRSWAIPYKGIVPKILNIPGFDGVLIHPGNNADDTSGCILVGQNKIKGKVVNSVSTFDKLMNELLKDNDNIVLTID